MIYEHVTKAERLTGMFLGHLLTALVGIGYFAINPETLTGSDVFYMGILGVFQLGIAYVFFCLAVDKISGFACSIIGAIEPLLNPVLVMIFVGETPGKYALWGSLVVIGAVTIWCMLDAKTDKDKKKTAVS
jgi:drug/metabolite transporter (DMT)-like permease